MKNAIKKRLRRHREDVVVWVAVLGVVVAVFMLDNASESHKWHPAILWTCTAFTVITLFGRSKWQSWRFWVLWVCFFAVHLLAMWWIFDFFLFPGHVWRTFLVIPIVLLKAPIAFVEGILVLGFIVRIERNLFRATSQ